MTKSTFFLPLHEFLYFSSVTYGVSSTEQKGIVKSFLKNVYKVDVEQLLTAGKNSKQIEHQAVMLIDWPGVQAEFYYSDFIIQLFKISLRTYFHNQVFVYQKYE